MLYGATNSPLRPILDEVKAIGGLKFDYLELAMDPPYCDSKNLKKQKREIQESLTQDDPGSSRDLHHRGIPFFLRSRGR